MAEAQVTSSQPDAVADDDALLCPAAANQQALWFIDRLLPGRAAYNIPAAFEVHGALRWDLVQDAIDAVVARHESLRTSFATVDGQPMQVIAARVDVPLRHIDLTAAADGAERAQELIRDEAGRPFDLSVAPLVRVSGLSIRSDRHILLIVVHHAISDGWSQAVLFEELGAVYRALVAGVAPRVADVAIQYADYCLWQEQRLTPTLVDRQLTYWRQALADAPDALELPSDLQRPSRPSARGDCRWFTIDAPLTDRIRQFCRAEGVTTFAVLMAALNTVLARYAGREDVIVGTPVAGRSRAELEGTVGFITNTIALRTDLSGDPSFRELVRRVRQASLGAFEHQDVPFAQVVNAVQPDRSQQRNPVFSVMCAVQRVPDILLDLGEPAVMPLHVHNGTAKFDWLWEFQERSASIEGSLEFNSDLFSNALVSRAVVHFTTLLDAALGQPDASLSSLDLLSADEHAQRRRWNETSTQAARVTTVLSLFDRQVDRAPDMPAVRYAATSMTYRQLSDRAWQWAAVLRDRGVGPGDRVGLLMPRSSDLLVALLAILRTGAAYVPMDPAYPVERLRLMAEDADLACIVADGNPVAEAWPDRSALVNLAQRSAAAGNRPSSFDAPVAATSPCYVMYTSGSTGRPKGVVMPHGALANLVTWQVARSAPALTTLQFGSPSFDVSFQEIFATWLSGGQLVVLPDDLKRDPTAVLDMIDRERVQRIFLPLVALEALAGVAVAARRVPASLVEVVTAGEQLRVTETIRAFFAALPGCALDNQYGPTESHVVTAYALERDAAAWSLLPPIGRPIDQAQIHILDRAKQPVPEAVAGDIWIGGACLADGYWRQPALTAERFQLLVIDGRAQRCYLSGDRGRYRSDGSIEFLGRADDQVKIRGYRVEPGEVEAALGALPDVHQAVVVARPHAGSLRLIAFVVPSASSPRDADRIRDALRRRLPDYLVPAAIVFIDALPVTPSGKVDRRRLPKDVSSDTPRSSAAARPTTALEAEVLTIWTAVLGVGSIGIDDNFFDVGGHSLAALQVFSAIESSLGVSLPLSALFETPTVRGLAARLDRARTPGAARTWPALVTITRAEGPPLVCVHSISGDILEYRDLAKWLGPSQHVIGVQATLDDDLEQIYESFESTAATYVAELRKVQANGPYYLSGWSSGGIVALEMAQQLRAAGEAVALLAIIDTAPVGVPVSRQSVLRRIARQIANIPAWIRDDAMSSPPADLLQRVRRRASVLARRLRHGGTSPLTVRDVVNFPERSGRWEQFVQAHFRAMRAYRATRYDDRVTLFRARTHPLTWLNDTEAAWRQIARDVDVHVASGTHFSIVREPNVRMLAEQMKIALAEATRRQTGDLAMPIERKGMEP